MYRNIMLAVDDSPSSRKATREAVSMAALAKATIHAVYVVDKSALFNYGGYYDPNALVDALRSEGKAALSQVHDACLAAGVACEEEIIETEGIADHIENALQRYVERCGADLAVMGTHGRRGVQRLVLGSVAERFLRFSTCPVMLVRGEPGEKNV
ncbi:universal stress protein [Trinickia caryophylli]|uniref:Universal stress protein n=1 Tax=Trinickia caryophylli TaxID=28094 RepID=A0A1X7GG07_TRICW|nr:universal stress protein [Trinickia caryophylli]PMS10728.1 universal stress protein [Trinickia caryophylli]TRX13898.1 universal stress protein [Trinickia caryophylli]WQE15488.1 universal stress protein [Trinickia caryophylli]SMF69138.1 Nucleotide-binding universal stress protein, UspA family [Trinickia caryophylli]GLU33767.1 universal stress protein [Trinickia caryophylli]